MFASFLLGSAVAYNLVMAIYRLHFHKLSKYPGPPLAAATGLYEVYFSVWGPDIFQQEIDEMHRKYGPVVRITPDEVHIQELFGTSSHADGWIKGTRELESGYFQPGRSGQNSQANRPSISRVRSLIRKEVHEIIVGLIEKHQVHKVIGSSLRPFAAEDNVQPIGENEIDDADAEHSSQSKVPSSL
ncbi:hypothetical protein N7457_005890 [Penicillium paradoxum]|uniref:uncharacterized protein n=1 Tax=Penicillium paradoxum TaxID=176176 RepID=UPI0025479C8B|nr:uncharacterized protein N7457_005890 [Penicillium paradoxum]KAJ5780730.1 hypothetical protein N7457_005890 [Penicillium paradoxum]